MTIANKPTTPKPSITKRTSKQHRKYTERLTAEIIARITDIMSLDHVTNGQFIRAQEAIQNILIRETHDVEDSDKD